MIVATTNLVSKIFIWRELYKLSKREKLIKRRCYKPKKNC